MLKSDLVRLLVQEGYQQREAAAIVNVFFESMAESLCRGEGIELRGFGSFAVREYAPYVGRDPRTNEPVSVGARRGVLFRTGKALFERMNPGRSGE